MERIPRLLAMVLLGALSAVCACSGSGGKAVDGGPDPLPLDEPLGPGQVRAGVISKRSELFSGVEAHGWLGDFKIYNQRVGFIVQNPFEPRGWGPFGGTVVDATWFDDQGTPAEELFEELFPNIDMLTIEPSAGSIVNDGADGQAARIRIEGRHHGIPLFDGALGDTLVPLDLELIQEYILAADEDHLRIRTSIRVRSGAERILTIGDLVLNGDRTTDFVPGRGDAGEGLPAGDAAFFGGYAEGTCNLYTGAAGPIRPMLTIEGITPISAARELAPKVSSGLEPLVVERLLFVGRGGMDDCLRKLRRQRGQADRAGLISGRLTTSGGDPESGARIYAHDHALPAGADVVDQTFTAADGSFTLELPAGEYHLEATATARDPVHSDPVTVTSAGQEQVDLQIAAPAVLAYRCLGQEEGGEIPCKLSLQAGWDAALAAPVNTAFITFGTSGQGEAILPAGDWTVTFSRGWEYSIARHNVSLAPGQRLEVESTLSRQVDTAGYIAADLHNHSTRSADSEFEILDKLSSNMAEGLELMVATDHDCQSDFAPYLVALGEAVDADVSRWLRTVVGNEVSPLYAHMTVFPLATHPTGWIFWQIPWVAYEDGRFSRLLEYPELWVRARELGAEVINIAHPLESSGYFNYLGYDPPSTMPALDALDSARFGTGFDTMELLNGHAVDEMLNRILPLWAHLNNQGLFRTASGVSDSHARTSEAGFGRTMVLVDDDQPFRVDLDQVWQNLRAGRASVGGGIFITIAIGEAGMGEMVQASGSIAVRVRVQAADWVPVATMDLWANGAVIETRALPGPGVVDPAQPALRLDETFSVDVSADTWFAAVAYGAPGDRLDPVFRGARPVGLANAIRVDADGDGQFTPPGL